MCRRNEKEHGTVYQMITHDKLNVNSISHSSLCTNNKQTIKVFSFKFFLLIPRSMYKSKRACKIQKFSSLDNIGFWLAICTCKTWYRTNLWSRFHSIALHNKSTSVWNHRASIQITNKMNMYRLCIGCRLMEAPLSNTSRREIEKQKSHFCTIS